MDSVHVLDSVWLSHGRSYICGDDATLADLAAICDIETVDFLNPDYSSCR